jgi:hypothetical protein
MDELAGLSEEARKLARRWYVTEDSLKEFFSLAESEAKEREQ